ncbi:CxxxxCH/CxxCH domain c-type cytochrome [Anaeromyxobacter oryzae]|uniref:Cytochrome C family protein n=1 Tax=Anaeromyxobacter oryzae TaxID=2918170 RepID=A0ABN6N1E0_9BACT|nr:CxxxxCH/CxxCH domain-containing protein [Anaeromyxobacter oryzae]BDG05812.1 hypothetical protein AMOR_48080 [Anaeromyxobacter oryzae]
MPRKLPTFVLAAALLGAVVSCDAARPVAGSTDPTTASGTDCTHCHGDPNRADASALVRAAPPVSVDGSDGGAHLAHLRGGALRGPVDCAECHVVPTSTRHFDGKIDLSFGPLARSGGAQPVFAGGSCASVYCHGATLSAGGSNIAPVWTAGASQAACGTCHGAPPPAPHTTSTACESCHTGYTATSVNLATHINGTIEVAGAACTSCHGDATRASNSAAPPLGTKGETATTTRAVGAHQVHLNGNALGNAVACTECHTVPTSTSHSNGVVDMTWGTLSKTDGAVPTWTGTTCANYCHGSNLNAGGTNTTPSWTGGSAQAACGTCHDAPPPPPHTTSIDCGSCHAGYTATTVNLATHINGTIEASSAHPAGWSAKEQHGYTVNRQGLSTCKICHGTNLDGVGGTGPSCASCHQSAGITSWQTSCTFCHGNRTSSAANPPVDTQGGTAATNVSVGVHAAHVGTTITAPIGCVQCHPDRTGSNVITDAAHIDGDGVAEVVFGALAKTGGVTPVYSRASATSATCSSTYCHGNFFGGATTAVPSWTSTTQATCTTCHGAPPSVGAQGHHSFRACSDCHVSYTSTSVNVSLHMNGTPDVGNRITSYSTTTHTCTNSCHGNETWR